MRINKLVRTECVRKANDVAIKLGIISLSSFSPLFELFAFYMKELSYGCTILRGVLSNKIITIPTPNKFREPPFSHHYAIFGSEDPLRHIAILKDYKIETSIWTKASILILIK